MGNSNSGPKITSEDRAILDLKLQRDKIHQYQKQIQTVLDREHQLAQQFLAAGNKQRALVALRQRKYQEKLLSQADEQLATLQRLVSSIEFALIEKDVVYGLKEGNRVLKNIHNELSVENVEKLMDETADNISYQEELNRTLSHSLSLDDEDAVQAELDAIQKKMEQEEEQKQKSKATEQEQEQEEPSVQLPSVPSTDIPTPVAQSPKEEQEREQEEEEQEQEGRRQAVPA